MTCYTKLTKDGPMFLCGDLGEHCADSRCNWISERLCDFPVGDEKTCDRPLCVDHAYQVAPDIEYCQPHYNQWIKFKEDGGVKAELQNVVPFKDNP